MQSIELGEELMRPTTVQPADQPDADPEAKPPAPENDNGEDNEDDEDEEEDEKSPKHLRIAFRPVRTKLQQRAKQRRVIATDLAKKIKGIVEEAAKHPTTKFESTTEKDETRWKESSDRTHEAEAALAEAVRKVNDRQKAVVLENLGKAIEKAIDPKKLFNLGDWISITTNATSPVLETLFKAEAIAAAVEIGQPDLDPFSDGPTRLA